VASLTCQGLSTTSTPSVPHAGADLPTSMARQRWVPVGNLAHAQCRGIQLRQL